MAAPRACAATPLLLCPAGAPPPALHSAAAPCPPLILRRPQRGRCGHSPFTPIMFRLRCTEWATCKRLPAAACPPLADTLGAPSRGCCASKTLNLNAGSAGCAAWQRRSAGWAAPCRERRRQRRGSGSRPQACMHCGQQPFGCYRRPEWLLHGSTGRWQHRAGHLQLAQVRRPACCAEGQQGASESPATACLVGRRAMHGASALAREAAVTIGNRMS